MARLSLQIAKTLPTTNFFSASASCAFRVRCLATSAVASIVTGKVGLDTHGIIAISSLISRLGDFYTLLLNLVNL